MIGDSNNTRYVVRLQGDRSVVFFSTPTPEEERAKFDGEADTRTYQQLRKVLPYRGMVFKLCAIAVQTGDR